MATRDKPNNYFAWYNDDDRLAVVERQTSTTDAKGVVAGEYDTFLGSGNLSGTISTFADYNGTVAGTTKATTSSSHGLDTNDTVTIASSPDSYYDGDYTITKIDADEFYFTKAYSAEDSGTFTSLFVDDGIRMTVHSKYEDVDALTDDLQDDCGLDSMMHSAVLDYVRSRVLEDMGQLQEAQYFKLKYEQGIAKKPTRRSGVRFLSVPRI